MALPVFEAVVEAVFKSVGQDQALCGSTKMEIWIWMLALLVEESLGRVVSNHSCPLALKLLEKEEGQGR